MAQLLTLSQLYCVHQGKLTDTWSLYLDEFDRLLTPYRDMQIGLLEIGVQNGGSLEIWSKYFSNAVSIIGCDIDQKCQSLSFDDPRIRIIIGDATSDTCEAEILQQASNFDVIIDDGSHKSSDIIRSFARYFPILREGGVYIVEDMHSSYWLDFGGGLYSPLSAMAFFKRLADVPNYEHWRINKSRIDFLKDYSDHFGIHFNNLDLTRIHSIEFINSLCVIKKMSPENNILGRRNVNGVDENITKDLKKYDGTAILDVTATIEDDCDVDVFQLTSSVKSLREELNSVEQREHTQQIKLAEREQQVQSSKAELAKLVRQSQSQIALLAERERQVQSLKGNVADLDEQIKNLQAQIIKLENQISNLSSDKKKADLELRKLRAHHDQREEILQNLNSTLMEIYSSTAWKLVKYMWRVRLAMAPHGSKRENFSKRLLGIFFPKKKTWTTNNKVKPLEVTQRAITSPNIKWVDYSPLLKIFAENGTIVDGVLPKRILEHAQLIGREKSHKISVIIPAWNRQETVCEAINSALTQSFQPHEIIVADDGSDDDTLLVIRNTFKQQIADGKIVLLQNPHHGVSYTRNAGLRVATGEIITYLDSDCVWRPDYLLLVNAIYTEVHALNTAYFALQSKNLENNSARILFKEYSRKELLVANFIDLNVFSHRRHTLQQYGLFDESLSRLVDWDLIIRHTRHNLPAAIPYIGVDYYLDSNRLGNITYTVTIEENRNYIYQKYHEERLQLGIIPLKLGYVLWDFPALSQTFVINEIRWLVKHGVDIKVYFSITPEKAVELDFPLESFQVKDAEELARLLHEHGRNYCHSHFVYPAVTLLTYPACVKNNIPFTFMPHAIDLFLKNNDQRNNIGPITQNTLCRKVLVYGEYHKKFLEKRGVPPEKLVFTFQAVDIESHISTNHRKKNKKSWRGVFIGRFIEKKGAKILIDAARLLKNEPVFFELYGYGPQQIDYENQIKEYGLSNVRLMGPVKPEELEQIYSKGDFLLVPSIEASNGDMDGFPTVILEAMSYGMPVITTSVSAVPDYIQDQIEALLVTPGDAEELATAIRSLIYMPDEKRKAIVERAKSLLGKIVGTEKTINTLLDIWLSRNLDILMITYNEDNSNISDTKEIIQRIINLTSTPYTLTIIDNASHHEFWCEILELVKNRSNVRLIRLDKNIFLGPATNLGVRLLIGEFAIYICSNEGFVKKRGWERELINYMREHPQSIIGGHFSYQPKYVYGHEIVNHPNFETFRARDYITENPHKPFLHIQGGIFIFRRSIFAENGLTFNPSIPQANMDVEMSYFLESKGYKLTNLPSVISITKKTLPPILAHVDENTNIAHPLSFESKGVLDTIGTSNLFRCNMCGWEGEKFLVDHSQDLFICPNCESDNFSRTTYRLLANDYRCYRGASGVIFSNNKPLLKNTSLMFDIKLETSNITDLKQFLINHKNQIHCVILDLKNIKLEKQILTLALESLDDDGEIIFEDTYWMDTFEAGDAKTSRSKLISRVARRSRTPLSLEYYDYRSYWLGLGWKRIAKLIRVN